ncbi:s-norcoclaurine synthase 1 [Quercus suber]|uniref:S-norcoclaurine synthase 1 n=1 Tax=Quercus suber TaxID=58331 RepID=A0AAW0KUH1_QUESU
MALAPSESLEWSPPVPSVQELAIQNLDKVPLRYVRDDLDQTTPSNPSLRVPLIDMNKSVNPEFHEKVLQKLHFAIINHGVFDESLSKMRQQVQEFFDLPLQEKKRWAQKTEVSKAFVTSEEQKLEWNDMMFLKTLPLQDRSLNFWPKNPQEFSNGNYTAPDHRAVVNNSNKNVNCYFLLSQSICGYRTRRELIKSGSPPVYKTLTNAEYFHSFFNRKLEVSFIDSLKI